MRQLEMVKRNDFGFTLVELMIVVVIIGVLATVAMPAYKKYIMKSKMAEAYEILGTMEKHQITYYSEYNGFYSVANRNPAILGNAIISSAAWDIIGYPAPVGTKTIFAYDTAAGRTNSSGTEISATGTSVVVSWDASLYVVEPGAVDCNKAGNTVSALGVTLSNSYDWAIVTAVTDLDGDPTSLCTGVSRVIESKVSTGKKPSCPSGFLITNYGK